jgi:cytochrome d oxidase subunit CydB
MSSLRCRRGGPDRPYKLGRLDSFQKALAMATFWFWTIVAMLAAYATLDGFDLGAGIIYLLVARTEEERRAVLRSIGPVWDGNEVWLISGGAVLFLAFPALYASSFSGFYLPLMIVLWLFMMRGIFHSNVMYPCRSGGEGLSFDS